MAAINNSINLTDRMSPVLKKILKAMDSTLKAMDRIDKASNSGVNSAAYKQMKRDITAANNALNKLSSDTDKAGDSATNLANKYRLINSSLQQSPLYLGNMITALNQGVQLAERIAGAFESMMNKADAVRSQKARLELFNTSELSSDALYSQVYATAQNTRTGLDETSNLVNKILMSGVLKGENAPSAAIGTAGIINKALIAGGATSEENARALLQLSQALSSGILQGDELRSIREQAPYLTKILAEGLGKVDDKFIGTTIGDLKKLGSEGELTADVVLKAFWAMSDEVDEAFDNMPKTFGQGMTILSNIWQYFLGLLSQTGGPLEKVNNLVWSFIEYLNSDDGTRLMSDVATGLNWVVNGLSWILSLGGGVIDFFSKYGSLLAGIVTIIVGYNAALLIMKGVLAATAAIQAISAARAALHGGATLFEAAATETATGAQVGLNAALAACPIVWILIIIIAVIAAIIALCQWIANVTGVANSSLGIIVGALAVAAAFIGNLFIVLINLLIDIFVVLWNFIAAFANFFANVFNDPVGAIARLFFDLVDTILSLLQTLASAIDTLFGSNLAGAVQGWRDSLGGWVDETFGKGEEIMEKIDAADFHVSRFEYGDAWKAGVDLGDSWADSISNALDVFDFDPGTFDPKNYSDWMNDGVDIAGGNLDSVGSIKNDVNINDEDIQLLRDMAARDYLLNLQQITPVAHISFGDVRETADVNKIMDVIEDMVEEQMSTALVSN